jgi:hypothetical protein
MPTPTPRPVPSVDPQSAIGIARATKTRAIDDARQRARFESMPAAEFDRTILTRYAAAITDAETTSIELAKVFAQDGRGQIPVKTAEEGIALRTRMLKCLDYHFEDVPSVRDQLDVIRRGTGYRDLASDLMSLSVLYAENDSVVARDPKHYRASDASDAQRVGAEIQSARIDSQGAPARRAAARWGTAFYALLALHDEIASAGRWLDRKSADVLARYPSLYSAVGASSRSSGKKEKKPKEDAPSPATS